jgi:DNA-binding FadR family transcriptional regulator
MDIFRGKYVPGATLPTEVESAQLLDMSRSAYREIVRILAAKGLVETRSKAGTRVTPRHKWHMLDSDVLKWQIEAQPGGTFSTAIVELQLINVPTAAALAAQRRTSADLEGLAEAVSTARHADFPVEATAALRIFRQRVFEASRNEPLASLASALDAALAIVTGELGGAKLEGAIDRSQTLYNAIAAGNVAEARWCMEVLIRTCSGSAQRSQNGYRGDSEEAGP